MYQYVSSFYADTCQVEESIEYFASTKKVEKCDLTLQHLENLELVSDNGGWEVEKLNTLFKVGFTHQLPIATSSYSVLSQ